MTNNPLNESHLATINATLDRIVEARKLLGKCENCGLPVQSILDDLTAKENQLAKVKQEFFPMAH